LIQTNALNAMPQTNYRYLTSRVESNVLVITLTVPQLQDEAMAQAIQDELLAAVGVSVRSNVVVDLQNIRYVSSVAFRPLLRLRRELQDSGGRLILCGLTRVVGDVFYTTRLVSADGSFVAPFEMETDVAAAIARMTQTNAAKPRQTD
jgi:anti-anti-sigma factor